MKSYESHFVFTSNGNEKYFDGTAILIVYVDIVLVTRDSDSRSAEEDSKINCIQL